MLSKRLPRQGQLRLLGCRWRDVTEDEGRPPVVQAARSRRRRPEHQKQQEKVAAEDAAWRQERGDRRRRLHPRSTGHEARAAAPPMRTAAS